VKRLILLLITLISFSLYAQFYTGEMGFNYLNIPVSPSSQAFSTAGAAATGRTGDLINPASLCAYAEDRVFGVNYMNYIAGSHFGLFSYSFGQSQAFIKYFNSGAIERRDSLNTDLGTYSANVVILNFSRAFSITEKMKAGAGVNIGVENITEYNGAAGTIDAGFIYKNIYSDFLSAGISIMNLGAVYDFEETSMTPARITAGIAIGKDDMPFAVYADAGKILDSKYFYAAGMEFFLVRPVKAVPEQVSFQSSTDSNLLPETPIVPEAESQMLLPADSAAADSTPLLSADTLPSAPSDTVLTAMPPVLADTAALQAADEYQSYADYLDEETKKEELPEVTETMNADTASATNESESTAVAPKPAVRNKGVFDPLAFSFRWGFSSDRENLRVGYGSDLFAGLTAGFKISYDRIRIDYSAKMWGQLGVSQSFGLGFTF